MVYGYFVVRNVMIFILVEKPLNVSVIWDSCKLHILTYSHLELVLKLVVVYKALPVKSYKYGAVCVYIRKGVSTFRSCKSTKHTITGNSHRVSHTLRQGAWVQVSQVDLVGLTGSTIRNTPNCVCF